MLPFPSSLPAALLYGVFWCVSLCVLAARLPRRRGGRREAEAEWAVLAVAGFVTSLLPAGTFTMHSSPCTEEMGDAPAVSTAARAGGAWVGSGGIEQGYSPVTFQGRNRLTDPPLSSPTPVFITFQDTKHLRGFALSHSMGKWEQTTTLGLQSEHCQEAKVMGENYAGTFCVWLWNPVLFPFTGHLLILRHSLHPAFYHFSRIMGSLCNFPGLEAVVFIINVGNMCASFPHQPHFLSFP